MAEDEHDVDIPNTILIDLDKTDKFNLVKSERKGQMTSYTSIISKHRSLQQLLLAPGRFAVSRNAKARAMRSGCISKLHVLLPCEIDKAGYNKTSV